MDRQSLLEKLADLEHQQWEEWSKDVAKDVTNPERLERWKTNWVPYDQLDESTKDLDREWAEEVMKLIEPELPKESAPAPEKPEEAPEADVDAVESKYPAIASALRELSAVERELYPALADAMRSEAHCHSTWMQGLQKLGEAQATFNQAMQMSSGEALPMEMKSQLADFVAQVYSLQAQAEELFSELAEVDAGAPKNPPKDDAEAALAADTSTDEGFIKYMMKFYGPGGIYRKFFTPALKEDEVKKALEMRKKSGPAFEGDSVDREWVRDILLRLRGHNDTEHDVSEWM